MLQENIETARLRLRPFKLSDAERVALLAGDKVIADMTANIPHPYEPYMAEDWIQSHKNLYLANTGIVYAITLKGDDSIIGAVSFPNLQDGLGILGYWLGVEYWGNGFAFEASKGLIAHCKSKHGLKTIEIMHLVNNERSKSVIKKLGVAYVKNRILLGTEREVCVYRSEL